MSSVTVTRLLLKSRNILQKCCRRGHAAQGLRRPYFAPSLSSLFAELVFFNISEKLRPFNKPLEFRGAPPGKYASFMAGVVTGEAALPSKCSDITVIYRGIAALRVITLAVRDYDITVLSASSLGSLLFLKVFGGSKH